jgi:vacuolar iron transporter family protein
MAGGSLQLRISSSIREIVFGLEDSLVSTLGVVTGIAAGTGSSTIVILSGAVLIFVEALSMTAGSYLSSKAARDVFERRTKEDRSRLLQSPTQQDESLHEFLKGKKFKEYEVEIVLDVLHRERRQWLKEIERSEYRFAPTVSTSPVYAAMIMGCFFLIGGAIPLLPYFFFSIELALAPSIILTAGTLFGVGALKAKMSGTHFMKSGIEMMGISLTAAVLGFFIGRLVSALFGVIV